MEPLLVILVCLLFIALELLAATAIWAPGTIVRRLRRLDPLARSSRR